jgi:hypothetical protein
MDIPAGAIPVDQFEAAQSPGVASTQPPAGAIPVSEFQSQEEAYGGAKQGAIATGEGVAQGLLGPVAPYLESQFTSPEAIRGRAAQHPIAKTVGELGGFTAGMMTGTGEAEVMSQAGKAATEALGLSNLGKEASYGARVGSSAVQQAAEMAVLQGGDETAKKILQDPDYSAESAISNIGMAAALGGAGGAFITGAVSPLWKATIGPKVDDLLGMVKNHVDGSNRLMLPEEQEKAAQTLGIKIDPVMRSGMSDSAKANEYFGTLRRSENKEVLDSIDTLKKNASDSVAQSVGVKPEEVLDYSENKAGKNLSAAFENEFKQKYEPLAKELDARDAKASKIKLNDDDKLFQRDKLLERGMTDFNANSPYYKIYSDFGDRLLDVESIGDLNQLKSEVGGELREALRSGNTNKIKAYSSIQSNISNFHDAHVSQAFGAENEAVNKNYSGFRQTMDDLASHVGIKRPSGYAGLMRTIKDEIAPEKLLSKFSIEGNSDFIPFLQKNFPDTFGHVVMNERKQLIKPAILAANKKGEVPIDVSKLNDIIRKRMAEAPEYVRTVLPQDAINKADAAEKLIKGIPSPRDSGTPAGMMKIFKSLPTSALAAVGWLTGHGPIASLLFGETANRMAVDAPLSYKLAYLRFMSSDAPIKSEGFKAMVDFIHATYKGESLLAKASSNVLKAGAQIVPTNLMPDKADREKLDKAVSKNNSNMLQTNSQNVNVGHYLPQHQTALSQTTTQATQYLQSLKPQTNQNSPLDTPAKPLPAQTARYNRALDIAQQPAIVLQHVKSGTLQTTDVQDLKAMYPNLYSRMSQDLTNELASARANEENIPYKTKIGISLFLGQPMDSSMTPMNIVAAQPIPRPPPPVPQGKNRKSTSSLGKSNNSYKTATQAAESDRTSRD